MRWSENLYTTKWAQEIINYDAKMKVAKKIASFAKDGDIIGFGSGSTSYLAICEIAKTIKTKKMNIKAIPTSYEISMLCHALQIPVISINEEKPNWSFDGADEVFDEKWLIKGRGGAMFREKQIMSVSPKNYILIDETKRVKKLCEKFPVPIECAQESFMFVQESLLKLGASRVELRLCGKGKDGPVVTEHGNVILDAWFNQVSKNLEKDIKAIVGVIDSGLFMNYPVEIIQV